MWSSNNPNDEYRFISMKRLPFGFKASIFLIGVTKNHMEKFVKPKSKSFKVLNSVLYVDNYILSEIA